MERLREGVLLLTRRSRGRQRRREHLYGKDDNDVTTTTTTSTWVEPQGTKTNIHCMKRNVQ